MKSPSNGIAMTDAPHPAGNQAPEAGTRGSSVLRVLRSLSTLVVVGLLAALGYWGHHTGWSFSTASSQTAGPAGDGVISVEPGPLAQRSFGWCSDHDVHDCPICHPRIAQLEKPPEVSQADRERIRQSLTIRSRAANDPQALSLPRVLRFPSAEAVEKVGIDIVPVWQTAMTEAITASGEVSFEPTRVARLSARVAGTAWQVRKQVGDVVNAGEILAFLDAAEVGKTKAVFQQALVQSRLRAQALANLKGASGVVSERQRLQVEAAVREAETQQLGAEQALINLGLRVRGAELQGLGIDAVAERLQGLGLPDDLLQSPNAATLPGTLLPVRTALEGTILQADVIAGEAVEPGQVLFVVADARRLWLTLHVPSTEARWLARGQQVRFRPDGDDTDITSTLTWIGTTANETTRTIPVRAELANEAGQLRAFTFGTGRIVLREEMAAVAVPHEAVQQVGGNTVVFVRDKDFLKPDGPKVFHVRTVRTGARDQTNTEILVGVLPGEIVATRNSSLLANELRKVITARSNSASPR